MFRKSKQFNTVEEAIPYVRNLLIKTSNKNFIAAFVVSIFAGLLFCHQVSNIIPIEPEVYEKFGEQIAVGNTISIIGLGLLALWCFIDGIRWRLKDPRKIIEKGRKKSDRIN